MLKTTIIKSTVIALITISVFVFKAYAQEPIKVELLDDAKVFAQYDDEKPLVANYFTSHNEQEIIAFYEEKYGEIVSQERKKELLTLRFSESDSNIRIIVSKQNNKHQVDILIN
ncbi:hypothetical protein [Thalassotalea profundi]|uniref:Uncharacterized protein n=1 Tax=Thalassotalea profundi TaxID=2036687 RepID=A0ABQ3J6K5_9GAMM|nr:hypothetical protein [Thalassotalea profundi]GHF01989.1 hypothetical protein GCM10011501_34250 [Thalassotalea profundi]